MNQLKNIARVGIMAAALAMVAGCTTAGPFVTNISSDGKGGIIVEKNTVKLNAFTGVITTGYTRTTQTIQIVPQQK